MYMHKYLYFIITLIFVYASAHIHTSKKVRPHLCFKINMQSHTYIHMYVTLRTHLHMFMRTFVCALVYIPTKLHNENCMVI